MGKVVTLGEIMLRLSTEVGRRIPESKHFAAQYGGGEANVAISLALLGHQVSYATKVPDNLLGIAVKQHLSSYGVDTSLVIQGGPRLGIYYLESGVGERSAKVIYDRAGSSFAQMKTNEWGETLFAGIDILHLSGITAALSTEWTDLLIDLMKLAKAQGCKISFDVNYRSTLWTQEQAGRSLGKILPYVDYCSAGKMDALYLLGIDAFTGENIEEETSYYYREIQKRFPNIQAIYSTKRKVYSSSKNDLVGTFWIGNQYYESQKHPIEPIVDRVGGGDAFSAGIIHGLLSNYPPQEIIDFATAASALKHTILGDANLFLENEIKDFLKNGSSKIVR